MANQPENDGSLEFASQTLLGLFGDDVFPVESEEQDTQEEEQEEEDLAPEDGDEEEEQGSETDTDAEEEQEDGDPEDSWQQIRKIKVAGEDIEITPEEALAGYQRQQDYTRKTQTLAEERRTLDAARQGLEQEVLRYAEKLQALEDTLTATAPKVEDLDKLRRENPTQYAEVMYRREQIQAIQQERQKAWEKAQVERMALQQQVLANEEQKLVAAIPEWVDEDRARADKTRLVQYASDTLGFAPEELAAVTDHRAILMLRKAMLFDEAQSRRKEVVTKTTKTAPILKPGASRTTKTAPSVEKKNRERLARTGKVQDAAAVLFDFLG
jgi:hypothetical protein